MSASDVPELSGLLLDFANSEGFLVEDIGKVLPARDARQPFYLKLSRDKEIEIVISDFVTQNKFLIAIYQLKISESSQSMADHLEKILRDRWPDKLIPYPGL